MLEELQKISPQLLVLLCGGLILVVWFFLKSFFKHLLKEILCIKQKIDYVIIEQQATDFALNEQFRNGFSKNQEAKREVLLREYEFKHNVKVEL